MCSTRVNLNGGIDGTRETTSALRMLRADVRGLDFFMDRLRQQANQHRGGHHHRHRRWIGLLSWLHRHLGMQQHQLPPVPVTMLADATGLIQR